MSPDIVPLIVGLTVLVSSLISLRLGLSVAIIEILLGSIVGNFGMEPEQWMLYFANFGGVLLTFLAGTEIDTRLLKEKFSASFNIGIVSFILPFICVFLFTFFVKKWSYNAALIAGTALSTTSLAVVYSVLVETGLSNTRLGKLVMAATFITDMGTALALSILFVKPTLYTLIFISISLNVIYFADRFSHYIFTNPKWRNKVIEPEIKYVFLLLLTFMYFAKLGEGHAVLPAFVLGLLMSRHFRETSETRIVRNRLRTVAYAIITPLFFIVGGVRVSYTLIFSSIGSFALLFAIKIAAKFTGVFFLAKRYIPNGSMYTTLLMSTGLTFGTISSLYGLNAGFINQQQYSVLVGVVVASAVIPTFIAQKWFMPLHSEDIVDVGNGHNGNQEPRE
ncbi:MAG: cation:proton antiporter [candidate division Zixibacteria bacterium CG_4_9_14_3_um_filter_46_8]|nr:MAG: cation:proton antiporter [candidate division Zixibacteria bacterium CG_4_9_14_3_um_filter_46_8]